jgi:hypothetical protein
LRVLPELVVEVLLGLRRQRDGLCRAGAGAVPCARAERRYLIDAVERGFVARCVLVGLRLSCGNRVWIGGCGSLGDDTVPLRWNGEAGAAAM